MLIVIVFFKRLNPIGNKNLLAILNEWADIRKLKTIQ
jgi:hypothetical protein